MPTGGLIVERNGEMQRKMVNLYQRPQPAQTQSTSHIIIRKWQLLQAKQAGQAAFH